MNKILRNLLTILSEENHIQWDLTLYQDEFTYNASKKKTIGYIPFHIVYERLPRRVVDMVLFAYLDNQKSDDASDFLGNIDELQEQVRKRLHINNGSYKQRENQHIR